MLNINSLNQCGSRRCVTLVSYWLPCIIALITCFSCKENACKPVFKFKGITERNTGGILVSADQGDWTLKDKWGNRENDLFDTTYKTNCLAPSKYAIVAYPNPTEGEFQLVFGKSNVTHVDIRLVDSDCRVLISRDEITSNTIGLQPGNHRRNGIVRLYYKFVEDGCEYQGHGDIEIRNATD